MSAVEFFADVVTTGEVLGVDGLLPPELVTGVLGTDFAEHGSLDRDYGLVKFSWARAPGGPWCGLGFSVEAYRLAPANAAIEARYGPIRTQKIAGLLAELERRGVALTHEPQPDPDWDGYWQPESEVFVHVRRGKLESLSHPSLPLSDVGLPGLSKTLPQTLKHLLPLSEVDRRRWAERKQPDPRWWPGALAYSQHKPFRREHPEAHEAWFELAGWLRNYGREIGALSVADATLEAARFTADLAQRGRFEDRLPAADDVVRDCLDALPEDLRAARTAGRPAMMAKRLVDAAMRFEDRVRDPALAARLRETFAARWG